MSSQNDDNFRRESRRSVNQGDAWVREDDLNKLDRGKVEQIPRFRNRDSDCPTGRFLTKKDIWQRSPAPEQAQIALRSTSGGGRWSSFVQASLF